MKSLNHTVLYQSMKETKQTFTAATATFITRPWITKINALHLCNSQNLAMMTPFSPWLCSLPFDLPPLREYSVSTAQRRSWLSVTDLSISVRHDPLREQRMPLKAGTRVTSPRNVEDFYSAFLTTNDPRWWIEILMQVDFWRTPGFTKTSDSYQCRWGKG